MRLNQLANPLHLDEEFLCSGEAAETVDGLYTLPAGADLSAKQFFGIKINSSGQVILCATTGEKCDGILQNAPTSGQGAVFATEGILKVKIGGAAFAAGDLVKVHSDGTFETAALGTVSGSNTVGSAVLGRGVVGGAATAIGTVLISMSGLVATTAG